MVEGTPVAKSLAEQSRAIRDLSREIQQEFKQQEAAVKARNQAGANAIAASINRHTERLVQLTEALAASNPDAGPDQGLPTPPATGPGSPDRPDAGLPDGPPPVGPTGGTPEVPGQELPTGPPDVAGQPLPETPEPKG